VLDSSIHAELAHIWIAVPTENDNPLIERCFCGPLTAERSLFSSQTSQSYVTRGNAWAL
jgi:hypothetical protein